MENPESRARRALEAYLGQRCIVAWLGRPSTRPAEGQCGADNSYTVLAVNDEGVTLRDSTSREHVVPFNRIRAVDPTTPC